MPQVMIAQLEVAAQALVWTLPCVKHKPRPNRGRTDSWALIVDTQDLYSGNIVLIKTTGLIGVGAKYSP